MNIDSRFFARHTGRALVKITGEGEVEVFGRNWRIIQFILSAYRKLTGVARNPDEAEEIRKWKLIRVFFHRDDGVIETRELPGGS